MFDTSFRHSTLSGGLFLFLLRALKKHNYVVLFWNKLSGTGGSDFRVNHCRYLNRNYWTLKLWKSVNRNLEFSYREHSITNSTNPWPTLSAAFIKCSMMHGRARTCKFLVVDMYYHHLSISLIVNDYSKLNTICLTLS